MTDTLEGLRASLAARYQLDRELGRGGMATVYLARDLKHERLVALKVLAPELAATLGPERFIREIRLTARLDHPHILSILDSGEDAGRLWYTMPYVEGESLHDRLRRETQLPVEEAVRLAGEVAEALEYAHGRGIVHRDIKPQNILLSQGHARVADFGVARAADSDGDGLTATGLAVGTPAYMAPEQATGGRADARSDLYSLGCVLYEMLAGEPPFTGPSAQAIVTKRMIGPVPSVRLTRPDVPPGLDALITQTLSAIPAARSASAAAFAAALAQSSTSPAGVSSARRAGRAAAAALGALAVVIVAAGAWFVRPRQEISPTVAKRLAVLPFENLGRPDDESFADGLTQEITNRLSSLADVGVISRTSAMQYKGTVKSLKEIGRELGVGYVLEGSIQWTRSRDGGSRMRVMPQLVRVGDDRQLWADRYDAASGDIFEVQGTIATQVTKALDATLAGGGEDSASVVPTASFEAYNLHLRGLGLVERHDAKSVEQAIALYQQALQLDSTFALAHFYLGVCNFNLWSTGVDHTPDRRSLADQHLQASARFGPDLPEIRTYLGWQALEKGDDREALDQFAWVREHFPNREEGWWGLGLVSERRGLWPDALAAHRKSIELNPRASNGYDRLAYAGWMTRDYEGARRAVERGLAVSPDDTWLWTRKVLVLGTLGGHRDSAGRAVEDAIAQVGIARMGQELFGIARFLPPERIKALLSAPRDSFQMDEANYFTLKADLAYGVRDTHAARAYADSARTRLERLLPAAADDPFVRGELALTYALLGRPTDANAQAKRMVELQPIEEDASAGPHNVVFQAYVAATAGDAGVAIELLRTLLRVPSPVSVPALRADPRWDSIRDAPGFQELLATRPPPT